MRIIPTILCTILVTITSAQIQEKPEGYSSRTNVQFHRSSAAYVNNELQHRHHEAGRYERLEDPDKYEKPLEQSHYRQRSYHAPGSETEDSNEDTSFGIKGGRPNTYTLRGHSANYHNRGVGYFGQSALNEGHLHRISSQPESRYPPNYLPPGSNNPPNYQYGHHGYHNHGHGHSYGYHHQHHNHGLPVQETSSQSSSSINTNQNNDDQMISLDQTFDYSKFKNQGFGKEYLDNTEGQRVTTPRTIVSTAQDIRPIFETTVDDRIPEQPAFSSQMGNTNNGQTIQQGQDQNQQKEENMGQVFHEDQTTNNQFGSADQMGQVDDNQQQIDIGQSFLQGQEQEQTNTEFGVQQGQSNTGFTAQQGQTNTAQQGQTNTAQQGQTNTGLAVQQGQTNTGFVSQQGQTQTNAGSVSQQGQTNFGQSTGTIQRDNQDLKPFFEQIDKINQMQSRDHTYGSGTFNYGSHRNHQFQTGNHREIMHHTTGYIKPKYDIDFTQQHTGFDESDCGHGHTIHETESSTNNMQFDDHHKEDKQEETIQEVAMEPVEEMSTQKSFEQASTQVFQQEDNNMEMTNQEKQDDKSEGGFEIQTTTQVPEQEDNMEMTNQEKQDEKSEGGFETMTEKPSTTTKYNYHYHHKYDDDDDGYYQHHQHQNTYGRVEFDGHDLSQQHENGWSQFGLNQEDLTQQQEDLTQQHEDLTQQQEDLTQQQENGWSQLGFNQKQEDLTQQQEDLTQQHEDLTQQQEDLRQQLETGWSQLGSNQKQEDLTQQQQQNNWGQIEVNHEDLSQKPQEQNEEYGHLEFGGQQQENLNQKHEEINGYGNSNRYSTASSRTYSSNSYGHYNKEFATEVHDVSQQVQKVHNLELEEQKETAFEPEEIAVVEEEKPTEKPGFWRRIGGSISRTYETAKQKVKNNLG